MTWPLAAGMTRDVPGDLGDSLLNIWILGWGAEQVPRLLTGRIGLADFWNANIFHPEPLALSFSEHLFGQVLQILPVYHLTGNLILSYNLLFLSSFVLSGLGMYLLVRELLAGKPYASEAAFVAGLIYAFVPFRIAQVAHIQSLSSQWMPFALYGFRRFIVTGEAPSQKAEQTPGAGAASPAAALHCPASGRALRWRALSGGSLALLMQNWSCGYYLIFFAPFVVVFVLHQMLTSPRARDWRAWAAFAMAALLVAGGTWPFLSLYLEAQRVYGFERSSGEVIRFSADVYSYLTAPAALRLWGDAMQAYPKPEGELFFGLVPIALVGIAIVAGSKAPKDAKAPEDAKGSKGSKALQIVLVAVVLIQLAGFIGILFTGGFVTSFLGIPIRATNLPRLLIGTVGAAAVLLAVSRDARQRTLNALRSPLTLALVLTVLAMWLSLGPLPQSRGRVVQGIGLYRLFYDHVPGFDGLRVPARYFMVAAVFLSIAAGYGCAAVLRRVTRPAIVAAAIAALFLVEAAFLPMAINQTWAESGVTPPARIEPPSSAPPVYRQLASMPDARVVTEFPFGDPAWELRYVYYSTVHWKRLVNGYSGGFPQSYKVRVARLQRVAEDPDAAWQSLTETGTTHVIVHERAFAGDAAEPVKQWLLGRGAHEVGRFGGDVLYAVRRD